jgi:hypothetical protein
MLAFVVTVCPLRCCLLCAKDVGVKPRLGWVDVIPISVNAPSSLERTSAHNQQETAHSNDQTDNVPVLALCLVAGHVMRRGRGRAPTKAEHVGFPSSRH